MLKNPYPVSGQKHKITARVDPEDYYFLKRLLPMTVGRTDKIVSILFKKFIDELRKIDSITPIEPAWYVESRTYVFFDQFVSEFQRHTVGQFVGDESSRDDTGTAHGVRETLQRPSVKRTKPKGSTKARGRSVKGKKKDND